VGLLPRCEPPAGQSFGRTMRQDKTYASSSLHKDGAKVKHIQLTPSCVHKLPPKFETRTRRCGPRFIDAYYPTGNGSGSSSLSISTLPIPSSEWSMSAGGDCEAASFNISSSDAG